MLWHDLVQTLVHFAEFMLASVAFTTDQCAKLVSVFLKVTPSSLNAIQGNTAAGMDCVGTKTEENNIKSVNIWFPPSLSDKSAASLQLFSMT